MSEAIVKLYHPHKAQQIVLNERKRFNVVCCGRRWGKSKLAVNLLSEPALDGHPAGYFAPTYKLLEGTYKDVTLALEPIIKKKHENQFVELITGGVIDFWSLDNPNAGRSRKYKVAVVDEAAFVKNLWEAWTESIRPTLTDLKGDAWFFSTPKGKNDFYKLFARKDESNWNSWQMSTYTNPFIDATEIDEAKKDLPELAFSQEYLAAFNENVANPFGVQFIRQCIYPISNLPAVCYGIDLAKSSDYTVIVGLDQHGTVCHFERFQLPWRETFNRIRSLSNVPTNIDSTGVGDPIVEELQQTGGQYRGFKFNQTSKQRIMEGLAVAIQQRKIGFPEGQIVSELEDFEFVYTRSGVKYSAPSGLHDDCVCALALAWDIHRDVGNATYSWA